MTGDEVRAWLPSPGRADRFADLSAGDYQHRARLGGHPVQRFWHRQKWPLVESMLDLRRGQRILDVGGGSSETTARCAERGAFACGVDPFVAPLRFLHTEMRRRGVSGTAYAGGDVHALPFASGSFDRVVMLEVIEHIPRSGAVRYLAELRRVLAPGGRLFLTTPNYRSFWPLLEAFVDRFMVSARLGGDEHVTHLHPRSLRVLLEEGGFRVRRLGSVYHVSPFVAPLAPRLAERLFEAERTRGGRVGPILYAVAEAPA